MKLVRGALCLATVLTCMDRPINSQSLTGTTGLVSIPTAGMPADATITAGVNVLDRHYHGYDIPGYKQHSVLVQYISVGFLPFAEVGLRLTRANGVPGQALGDRMVTMRLRALKEGRRTPAVVVGAQDLVGTRFYHSIYAVASKSVAEVPYAGTVAFHAGYGGNPLSLKRAGHPLTGPFGGVSVTPARWASVFADYDTQHVNAGARLRIGRVAVLAAAQNLDGLSAGISYTQPLHH